MEERVRYHSYDGYGNPREISKDGAERVVYLWGYKGLYPIAEIRNATYANVVSKIPDATLKAIAGKTEPSVSDWSLLHGLRSSLPDAQITIHKYRPLVGVTETTAPSGIVIYYEYDGFGRLKEVYFQEGTSRRILENYQYNYKNH